MKRGRRQLVAGIAVATAATLAMLLPSEQRAPGVVVVIALALWLTEVVPVFVPTLFLLVATPWTIPGSPQRGIETVIHWAADPVLALFFGGLALSAAAQRHGIDAGLARALVVRSRGSVRSLCALVLVGTAFLSMWMSNVASSALVLAALGPVLRELEPLPRARSGVLTAVAMGANVGGLCTPIGSGPNGLAIAAVAPRVGISFAAWMGFAVPLAALLLATAHLIIRRQVDFAARATIAPGRAALTRPARMVVVLATLAVLAWLTEPLHGVPSALVSLALAAALFAAGLLGPSDLGRIDLGTLLLVAGGVVVGRLVEASGMAAPLSRLLADPALHPAVLRAALCAAAALLAAVMSNTATAALLLPIALRIDAGPTSAILVAVSTSLGCPFVVSTPPNALAARHGARAGDLLRPGLALMIGGVILVVLTGPGVLARFGL